MPIQPAKEFLLLKLAESCEHQQLESAVTRGGLCADCPDDRINFELRAPEIFSMVESRSNLGRTITNVSSKPTRYSSLSLKELVCLCAGSSHDEAWEEFVLRVRKPIGLTIMHTISQWSAPSRSLVEDLVQATYLKLWEGGRQLLREFAIQHPEAILGYLKRTAANVVHDYFKQTTSQSSGGNRLHDSTSEVDVESAEHTPGSHEGIARNVFLNEIDDLLKRNLGGPDQERDRTIFWLYFRQGMTTKEIASLPTMRLSAKGVGSVIERLKQMIREQILKVPDHCEHNSVVEAKVNSFGNSY